ncbi:hypothetical protein [Salmonirosea aquatica]|uniref:Uncharacterized protein n=1 Tax=Salmonirosea aquatica TaxID=2654236 RepID=A0A7C9FTC8_9BACT|nr:hypothetical protein [Cytophagaceae bacterium SJW1-29]
MATKPKICNQHTGPTKNGFLTIRCHVCEETTQIRMPIPIQEFARQSAAFVSLHTVKGCNKEQIH